MAGPGFKLQHWLPGRDEGVTCKDGRNLLSPQRTPRRHLYSSSNNCTGCRAGMRVPSFTPLEAWAEMSFFGIYGQGTCNVTLKRGFGGWRDASVKSAVHSQREPSSVPSTHIGWLTTTSSSREPNTISDTRLRIRRNTSHIPSSCHTSSLEDGL